MLRGQLAPTKYAQRDIYIFAALEMTTEVCRDEGVEVRREVSMMPLLAKPELLLSVRPPVLPQGSAKTREVRREVSMMPLLAKPKHSFSVWPPVLPRGSAEMKEVRRQEGHPRYPTSL